MEPVGRRTRLQRSINMEKIRKENKQRRIAARRRFEEAKAKQSGLNYESNGSDNDNESGGIEEAVAIDESEFLKGIQLLGCGNRICYNGDTTAMNTGLGERDKGIIVNDESSDYDNGNSLVEANEGDDTGVNGGVHSSDFESSSSEDDALSDRDFNVGNPEDYSSSSEVSSSSSSSDGSTSEEEEVCSRNGLDKHDDVDGGGRSVIKDKQDRKKKKKQKKISKFEFRKRVDEGLVCTTSQEKEKIYDGEKSLKGKRKKYNKKTDYPRKKSEERALVSPRTDDVEGASSFSSDSHDEDLQVPLSVRIPGDGEKSERVRPSKKKNVGLGEKERV